MLLVRADGQGPAGLDGYAKIVARVEKLRGLKFKTRPTLELLDERRLRARTIAAFRADQRRFPAEFRATDLLPTLAGVATREEYLRWLDQQYDVLGLFDFAKPGEVLVLDDPGFMDEVESEAVVAHELVHALEHQHFASARERGYDDRGWVTSALAEGSAMLVEVMYRREYLSDPTPQKDLLRSLTYEQASDLPPGLTMIGAFPYEAGSQYVAALHGRGGWDAVNAAHRRPPATSSEILHRRDVQAARPDLPSADAVGRGWRRLTELEIGEIDTRMLVARQGDYDEVAEGWTGGAAAVFQRGSGTCPLPCADRTTMVLAWRMRDAGEARQLAAALRRVPAAAYASVETSGSDVRMAIAPQATLARRLAAPNARR